MTNTRPPEPEQDNNSDRHAIHRLIKKAAERAGINPHRGRFFTKVIDKGRVRLRLEHSLRS